jgi:short-subunit dehydrogenase
MLARRKGQIAINGSLVGYGGLPRAAAYGATKAALIGYAESMYWALKRLGLTIQVVNPGFVKTPLTDKNSFPMPFLVSLEEASRRICDGFERAGFEIAFPKRLAFPLKILNLLPYPAYFWTVGKAAGVR